MSYPKKHVLDMDGFCYVCGGDMYEGTLGDSCVLDLDGEEEDEEEDDDES